MLHPEGSNTACFIKNGGVDKVRYPPVVIIKTGCFNATQANIAPPDTD